MASVHAHAPHKNQASSPEEASKACSRAPPPHPPSPMTPYLTRTVPTPRRREYRVWVSWAALSWTVMLAT